MQRSGWKMVDLVVTAGVLAASMMFFPAIANSRQWLAFSNAKTISVFWRCVSRLGRPGNGEMPYIPSDPKLGWLVSTHHSWSKRDT